MIHSTSLRAAGSDMADSVSVALVLLPARKLAMAFFTSAMSASEVSGIGACAGALAPRGSAPVRSSPELAAPAVAPGTAAALVLRAADFSFDLAAAVFLA